MCQKTTLQAVRHVNAVFWRLSYLSTPFSSVINCPQHHRLHHAKNEAYHDCNYGGILIVWDRWFGTFRDFQPGVAPVYGTLTPVLSTNPLKQGIMGWVHLLQKVGKAPGLLNKLKCLWLPPGWTPSKTA
ncbi:sterol desaturase family protein [Limnobacter humi]|uniref:Sterol desaturase family protein n=1 Tax=Limnobacter humi TaxID=1778671 RepID=A0ABT1WGU3_9BURK|nr:sterol desaturase family protein [Limnobacter humi]